MDRIRLVSRAPASSPVVDRSRYSPQRCGVQRDVDRCVRDLPRLRLGDRHETNDPPPSRDSLALARLKCVRRGDRTILPDSVRGDARRRRRVGRVRAGAEFVAAPKLVEVPLCAQQRQRYDRDVAAFTLYLLRIPERVGVVVAFDEEHRAVRKRLEQLTRRLTWKGCIRLRSPIHDAPVEKDRKRRDSHANPRAREAPCQRNGADAGPNAPRPEAEREEVVPVSRLMRRVVLNERPGERAPGAEIQVRDHAERAAREQEKDGAPGPGVAPPMPRRAGESKSRE